MMERLPGRKCASLPQQTRSSNSRGARRELQRSSYLDSTEKKTVNTVTGRGAVDALLREGVDHVFGIPGTQNLAIIGCAARHPQIRSS